MNKEDLINEILSYKSCIDDNKKSLARYLISNYYIDSEYQLNNYDIDYYIKLNNNNNYELFNIALEYLNIINYSNDDLYLIVNYDFNDNRINFISNLYSEIEYNNCINDSEKLQLEYFSEA